MEKQTSQYQFIAADGSSISFSSLPRFALDEYYISEGHSASGFYSMHINAFYDLNRHIYDVMSLLKKELIPVRPAKQFPRLKTAHFKKPKYLIQSCINSNTSKSIALFEADENLLILRSKYTAQWHVPHHILRL